MPKINTEKWAVPGLLREGLSVLHGNTKIGKSWLGLQTALAVAVGGKALGTRQVEQGDVLYLALGDPLRRIKDRVLKMLPGVEEGLDRCTIATDSPRLHEGGLESIQKWSRRVEHPRLVVVDAWERFRPLLKGNQNADYSHVAEMKRLAAQCPILLVHNVPKIGADTNLHLERPWMVEQGTLTVVTITAEGIEEVIPVEFDPMTYGWREGKTVASRFLTKFLDNVGQGGKRRIRRK